jgi:peptidoglycan/LPS O-acetylase OafA/YrhL
MNATHLTTRLPGSKRNTFWIYRTFVFLVFLFLVLMFFRESNNFEQKSISSECILDSRSYESEMIASFSKETYQLSIFPEFYNLLCINEIVYVDIENNKYFIGTSNQFIILLNILMASLLILSIYLLSNFKLIYLLPIFQFFYEYIFYSTENKFYIYFLLLYLLVIMFTDKFKPNIKNITRIKFREDINYLRAFSVLFVVLYHIKLPYFDNGWLGVDVFFVISGFLISNIIFSSLNTENFSFKEFYIKRVRRILPALYSMLIFSSILGYTYLSPTNIKYFFNSVVGAIFIYSNYFFKDYNFYFADGSETIPLLHTWSLSIEEQFYILLPALLFFVYKKNKSALTNVIIFITLFSLLKNIFEDDPINVFYNFELRIWELLLGVLITIFSSRIVVRSKRIYISSFYMLLISFFLVDYLTEYHLFMRLIILLPTSIILLSDYKFNNLKIKFLHYIGISSYSIYLFHQPLYAYLKNLKNFQNNIFLFLIFASLLTIISYLNFVYIEKKFNRDSFNIILLFIPLFLLLSAVYLSDKTDGFLNRYDLPEQILQYASDPPGFSYDNKSCQNQTIDNFCKSQNDSPVDVIGIGDSHLESLGRLLISNNQINYTHIGLDGCIYTYVNLKNNQCIKTNNFQLNDYFSKVYDSNVIVSFRWHRYFQFYKYENIDLGKEILFTFEKLLENNNKIFIVLPIPEQRINLIDSYLNGDIDFGDSIYVTKEWWYSNTISTYEFFESIDNNNIFKIDSLNIFCDSIVDSLCIGAYEDNIFYTDNNHLTLEGARLIFDILIDEINQQN